MEFSVAVSYTHLDVYKRQMLVRMKDRTLEWEKDVRFRTESFHEILSLALIHIYLKDLGVHTEMYIDAFADIAMNGRITGRKKTLDKGRQV